MTTPTPTDIDDSVSTAFQEYHLNIDKIHLKTVTVYLKATNFEQYHSKMQNAKSLTNLNLTTIKFITQFACI